MVEQAGLRRPSSGRSETTGDMISRAILKCLNDAIQSYLSKWLDRVLQKSCSKKLDNAKSMFIISFGGH
jgi:hypothetical protein